MSFACDPGVVTAAYVAEQMGLPHCGSYEAVSILQNKWEFRRFLRENGFRVPMAKGYHKMEDALKDGGFQYSFFVRDAYIAVFIRIFMCYIVRKIIKYILECRLR